MGGRVWLRNEFLEFFFCGARKIELASHLGLLIVLVFFDGKDEKRGQLAF